MAGIGFGGIILGRRSETKTKPLAYYGKLELWIAASAAISPFLIWAARQLYIALGGTEAMGMFAGTIVRLILAAIILGVPTFLMGGTLPAAARAAVAPDDTSRRAVGLLYGTNTLGAVTGAVVGTFFLFENFGNRLSLWFAAILNVGIALLAIQLSKSTEEPKAQSKPAREKEDVDLTQTAPLFVFAAAGLVGFAFFLMELVWYRMLGPLLGGSTFSFGLILAVALLGIGLGGGAYALFGLRRAASLQFFALTCAAEAFFIALPYALGDRIAMAAMLLRPLGTIGFFGHVIAWTSLCVVVIFPAAFVSGLQFPLLIALLGKGRKSVGAQTGAAYAWNTTGALLGSIAGGFGFMPMFSAPGVWRIVTILLAALALAATIFALKERRDWTRTSIAFVTIALAVLMLNATGPTAFWRHSEIGVGRLSQYQSSPNEMHDVVNGVRRRVAWEVDGIESSVALASADSFAFIVNGRSDGNAKHDAGTQIMSGLIGAALHPHPTKAMVIGLGTGSTAGWLAAVPEMEKVDVVELEPVVVRVAKDCTPVNHDALNNPKLHLSFGDARELLLTTRQKYDIVVSEPSNPYRAGVAGLFTREYYRSIDRCLKPGGLFFQWVQAYEIDDRTMEIFYRTLGSVFANIESWQTESGDLLLMASHEPVAYDVEKLRARLREEPFKTALLSAWRADGFEDFLAHYVGNQAVAETLQHFNQGPLNTDDRTIIEFAFARSVNLMNGFRLANVRVGAIGAHADRPHLVNGEINWARVDEGRLSTNALLDRIPQFLATLTAAQRSRAAAFTDYTAGDLSGALRNWRAQSDEPTTISELLLVSECLAAEGDSSALPYIDKLSAALPLDADAIRAEFLWRTQKPQESVEILVKFFQALREDPWPARELIERSLTRVEGIARSDQSKKATGLVYDALRMPFSVFTNETDRLGTLLSLSAYLDDNKPGETTLAALGMFEPYPLWQRKFLQGRRDCYTALNSPLAKQARHDFDEFIEHESATADVFRLVKEIEARAGASSN